MGTPPGGRRGDLSDMQGSFMNNKQKRQFEQLVETGGHDLSSPPGQQDFINEEDVTGQRPESSNDTSKNPKDQEENEQKEHTPKGDICSECGRILREEITFTDEELMNYLLGARISREFVIGKMSFRVQTLTQEEVDDANFRTGRDVEAGVAILNDDIRNRMSFYVMVFQLTHINNKLVGKALKGEAAGEELEEWHAAKLKTIKSYGHQLMVLISGKCSALEAAIKNSIEDEVRLKNS